LHFNARLRAVDLSPTGRANALLFAGEMVGIGADDLVILAVPPSVLARLIPDQLVPEGSRAILNLHYKLPQAVATGSGRVGLIGLVGATAQWLFLRGMVLSVTVSAADALMDELEAALLPRVWGEIRAALALAGHEDDIPSAPPPGRVVKEKR